MSSRGYYSRPRLRQTSGHGHNQPLSGRFKNHRLADGGERLPPARGVRREEGVEVGAPVRLLRVVVESSRSTLLVKGRDLTAIGGVELDRMPGSMRFAFGAYGSAFTVGFDAVEVSEV